MDMNLSYKSFCWNFGTTSFRTKNFNKTIEEQISLLDAFWKLPENKEANWNGNNNLQSKYYDFMKGYGFVVGNAKNKPKDAREKTSGLLEIGLLDDGRKLTAVGESLLEIAKDGSFPKDNFFQIPADSYIYLKQLLKTSIAIENGYVRPFIVLIYAIEILGYLSKDEFMYLIPLCTSKDDTEIIIDNVKDYRKGLISIDKIIVDRLMSMDNYKSALNIFLDNKVNKELICTIGMNRKSRNYDIPYYELYKELYSVFVSGNLQVLSLVFDYTRSMGKMGDLWRSYLFNTSSLNSVNTNPEKSLNHTLFEDISTEEEFKIAFFKIMHLLKAKATLHDYYDLNYRYVRITDIVLFDDASIKLDVIPKYFFSMVSDMLYQQAFEKSEKLYEDCPLSDIAYYLDIDSHIVIESVNREFGTSITTLDEARDSIENNRYRRFRRLIENKFTNEKLIYLLECFEKRDDKHIQENVTEEADVPTIFEYVLGIIWYKTSEFKGKILDYMKLSLDANLLPKTHANGGEADIVYEYEATTDYPKHCLLIEATLSDNTSQRKMEMEPVSRHLGEHLLKTGNVDSYCVFVTNELNKNVISDFRGRKNSYYYSLNDESRYVKGMKIIPLQISEIKSLLANKMIYKELYRLFDNAYRDNDFSSPVEWYEESVRRIFGI